MAYLIESRDLVSAIRREWNALADKEHTHRTNSAFATLDISGFDLQLCNCRLAVQPIGDAKLPNPELVIQGKWKQFALCFPANEHVFGVWGSQVALGVDDIEVNDAGRCRI